MNSQTEQHNLVELRLKPSELQHLARLLLSQTNHRMRKLERLETRAVNQTSEKLERYRQSIQRNQALFSKLVSAYYPSKFVI